MNQDKIVQLQQGLGAAFINQNISSKETMESLYGGMGSFRECN